MEGSEDGKRLGRLEGADEGTSEGIELGKRV